MPINHREIAFEDAIEHHLFNVGGYAKGDSANFDRERAIDPDRWRKAIAWMRENGLVPCGYGSTTRKAATGKLDEREISK